MVIFEGRSSLFTPLRPLPPVAVEPERAPAAASPEAVLLRLGVALHAAGLPSHELEGALAETARTLGVEAQFFSTPTSLFTALGEGESQRTHLSRVEPGDPDLSRLVDLHRLVERVPEVKPTAAAVGRRLEEIRARPPRYGRALTTLAFGLASAGAAVFFGGGVGEVGASLGLGAGVGALVQSLGRRGVSPRVGEALGAFLLTVSAALLAWRLPALADRTVTLAGLIVLVPGLTLTVGLSELARNHWISGTARLAGAFTVFLTLGLGVALGQRVGSLLPGYVPSGPAAPLGPWATWVALAVMPLAFTVLFRARPRDLGWILGAGWLGFLGARLGAATLGPELGAFAGAAVVGVVGNLASRWLGLPATVAQVPGIILLVPGSLGYQSVSSFLAQDVLTGVESAFRMVLVGASLVGGLFLSNAILASRRAG